jgi:hypothetical protein
VPYHVHTILTDNGIQFAEQPRRVCRRLQLLSRMEPS